jgi:hypothetical protein
MATSEWTRLPTVDPDATPAEADEEPRLPWSLWLHTCTARLCIAAVIIIWVPTAVGWYRFITASPGCHRPLCHGGALQCCPGEGSGAPCIARPDLVGLLCAKWILADRSCESYFCAYTGNATGGAWQPATDTLFEADLDDKALRDLFGCAMFGTVFSVFALITLYLCGHEECADLESEHKRRILKYQQSIGVCAV